MSTRHSHRPVEMHCTRCGSSDVTREAWARWNAQDQDWEVEAVFDLAWCHACDNQTKIAERTIARSSGTLNAASLAEAPPLARRH